MPNPPGAARKPAGGKVADVGGAGVNAGVMLLLAIDNRQTAADYGDIDKPGVETTGIEPELDSAMEAALELLRKFRNSPDVLGEIKSHIESYMETRRFTTISDPEAGVDRDPAPPTSSFTPHDDAQISVEHYDLARLFVLAVEQFYGGHFHSVENRGRIDDILLKYCSKISTIPGCLLARATFANISKLLDMLQCLQQTAMEIKEKIFPEAVMKDKFTTFIKHKQSLDRPEELAELFAHIAEQLKIMISVPRIDLLSFMSYNKSVLTFTIQARLIAKDKVEINPVKTEDFLRKFDDHEKLKVPLREILDQPTMSQVEFEKLSLSSEKAPGASDLGAVGGAFGGADLPKPGLLTPPPASPETEIPKTSEKEIEIRLPVKSKYIYLYNLCKDFGVISEIREMRSSPGTFTVAFEQKSAAEKALTSLEKDNFTVKMARLSGRPPLSETKLYMGDRTIDQDLVFDMAAQFSGFDKESSMTATNPKGEGYAFLRYKTEQGATKALEEFQKIDLGDTYVTRAIVRSEAAQSLSGPLSTLSSVEEPPAGQLPTLYFSKLPGEEKMTRPDCENYLRDLVGSIVQPETIIRVNVTQTHVDNDKSFRHGFCTLRSLDDCKFVISELRGGKRVKSKAKGFERSWLNVNWAKR